MKEYTNEEIRRGTLVLILDDCPVELDLQEFSDGFIAELSKAYNKKKMRGISAKTCEALNGFFSEKIASYALASVGCKKDTLDRAKVFSNIFGLNDFQEYPYMMKSLFWVEGMMNASEENGGEFNASSVTWNSLLDNLNDEKSRNVRIWDVNKEFKNSAVSDELKARGLHVGPVKFCKWFRMLLECTKDVSSLMPAFKVATI